MERCGRMLGQRLNFFLCGRRQLRPPFRFAVGYAPLSRCLKAYRMSSTRLDTPNFSKIL